MISLNREEIHLSLLDNYLSSYNDGEDEPGEDCPDHGPYADDECPKC